MNLADALSRISALVADGAESRRTAGDGLPVTALLAEARRRRRRFAAVTTVATAAAVALVAAGGASAMSHLEPRPAATGGDHSCPDPDHPAGPDRQSRRRAPAPFRGRRRLPSRRCRRAASPFQTSTHRRIPGCGSA